jgi:hypothetical protein
VTAPGDSDQAAHRVRLAPPAPPAPAGPERLGKGTVCLGNGPGQPGPASVSVSHSSHGGWSCRRAPAAGPGPPPARNDSETQCRNGPGQSSCQRATAVTVDGVAGGHPRRVRAAGGPGSTAGSSKCTGNGRRRARGADCEVVGGRCGTRFASKSLLPGQHFN